ncbi:uncharacterized protein LOC124607182 isoform X1 [Schistocerca americana]|uniref:uncharacterized protein LOC124607182 isoform X1 n=1 Tax=Schistocerca americana TaxID=7009 RepID=UPI001F502273|nr:uncharacterized protein LOC124607182 isoform X1 [Schistocerca americana]
MTVERQDKNFMRDRLGAHRVRCGKMRNNLSNSELLTYYEEESEKLRVFARNRGLDDGNINKIVHKSLHGYVYKNVDCSEKQSLLNTFIRKYSALLSLLKLLFVLVFIVTGVFIAQLYQKSAVNFIIRNVQELIYPAMKVLRFVSLPLVTNFPSISAWYDEICLIENPYFQASDMYCWPCEEVRSVLDLSETAEPVKQLPHAGFPFIVKGKSPKVTLSDVQIMYFFNKHIFDRDASRVMSNNKSWNTIEELVYHNLSENPTYLRDGHITWRINRLEPARIIRSLFKRPHFFPNTVNVERFILIDEANSPPYYQPLPEGYRVFLMQTCGERLIILEPVPGCNNNCSRVSVLLQSSDILYYNSWFYRAKSMPVTNTSSISITYVGSY